VSLHTQRPFFLFSDPDLLGFAFHRGTSVSYLMQVTLEEDENVLVRWMASKLVNPYKKILHVDKAMTTDNLAWVVWGENTTDNERLAFNQVGRTLIYPPPYNDDFACIVGIPRAFPLKVLCFGLAPLTSFLN